MINTDDKRFTCLVVDDSITAVGVAKRSIESLNASVDEAYTGLEALEKVRNNKYDIILMDILMPDMNGVSTYNEIIKIEGFNTPIIAVTSDNQAGAKEKYLSIGFDAYVDKPYKEEILLDVILKILSENKKED